MSRAVVLGCGPAGLLAAHALTDNGWDVSIASKKRKSEMFGAQYLHEPIPGITSEEGAQIAYLLTGSIQGYRDKVYGPTWDGVVSPDEYGTEGDHLGWNIRIAYDNLWARYSERILDREFKHAMEVRYFLDDEKPDLVVSSLPAPMLCLRRDEHVFRGQQVWAIGDAPERGIFCPVKDAPPNTVLCNGDLDVSWYRTANVFGYRTAEWPGHRNPPYEGIAEITKPLSTTCRCMPEVVRVGRYGKWSKGVLAHTAYFDLMELLAA